MAEQNEPEQRNRDEGDESQAPALEERVAQLELKLSELQQQIAAAGIAPRFVTRSAPQLPPPPALADLLSESAGEADGLAAASWPRTSTALPTASMPDSHESFESRLGSQIFNRIAIILLLIGTAYGLKLAVDRGLVGPTGRVIAGLLTGAGLVLWSERFRRKGFAAFSYSLKAVGSGVLYLSLWAAFQLFHLLPAGAALALMVLVTAWNAYMAWVQDSELLAAYALAGGFATPLLVSTGGNHEIFLFTYLLAIDVATVALVRLKTWPRLLLGAFPITAMFFVGWYAEFYVASELAITSIYIVFFGAVFASVPLGRAEPATQRSASLATVLEDILLPLANAAFVALAFYSVLQDSGHHPLLPWLMITLAAVYLGLMQAPQTRTAAAIHLSLAVVFLTIAIPLKASGHWITAGWLVEGLAVLWVATRLGEDEQGAYVSQTLRWLGTASLALGVGGVATHCFEWIVSTRPPLFNADIGTALVGMVIFAGAAWLALRASRSIEPSSSAWAKVAISAFAAIDFVALLLTLREVAASWFFEDFSSPHLPLRSADFLTALVGLSVFASMVAVSLRIAKERAGETFWMQCATGSTIAFNLIAVLTGVRELSAVWSVTSGMDAGLQQALAISAFLMLYGAALLAVGFWQRSGFLRAQALVLLVFSIIKTFLYDMRSLSQGYRVVSFLGLGALLMAISFAYQKDWLHLREPATVHAVEAGSDANSEERR